MEDSLQALIQTLPAETSLADYYHLFL